MIRILRRLQQAYRRGDRTELQQRQGRQRGDTIVEVLICIGIVSLILTGAFVTTNRSSLAIRDAQEHAEALKLAQSQLEQIRQNAASATPVVFDQAPGNAFCMLNAALATTAAQCVQDSSGTPSTSGVTYKVAASRADCSVGANCHQFTVKVEWDSISTKTKANEQIIYRLHK